MQHVRADLIAPGGLAVLATQFGDLLALAGLRRLDEACPEDPQRREFVRVL